MAASRDVAMTSEEFRARAAVLLRRLQASDAGQAVVAVVRYGLAASGRGAPVYDDEVRA